MPIDQLVRATPEQTRRFFLNTAWETVRWTAGSYVEAIEALFRLMVIGLVESHGADAARIYFCRDVVKGPGNFIAPRTPHKGASHPLLDHPGKVVAKLLEVLNVQPMDPVSWRASTPDRIEKMLGEVPHWLRHEVMGFSGQMVREGLGVINPADGSSSARVEASFRNLSWVVFAGEFVLGAWEDTECKSLLWHLFGIRL